MINKTSTKSNVTSFCISTLRFRDIKYIYVNTTPTLPFLHK